MVNNSIGYVCNSELNISPSLAALWSMVDHGDSEVGDCTPDGLQAVIVEAITRERSTETETIADESEWAPGRA